MQLTTGPWSGVREEDDRGSWDGSNAPSRRRHAADAAADGDDECRIDAFFYGLFVDVELLRGAGVAPSHPRRAWVDGFALRIGRRATLLPSAGARAYGMLFALTHSELDRLYARPGLEPYRPEAILVQPLEGTPTPALCYNLREAPRPDERNPEYAAELQRALTRLGRRDEQHAGWIWVTDPFGRRGWAPESLVRIGTAGEGVATEEHTAREPDVEIGR